MLTVHEMWATPPGTGNAGDTYQVPWPILWRAQVALSRRNARKGVGHQCIDGLRYVLIPWVTKLV
jgi:hypothetical protein